MSKHRTSRRRRNRARLPVRITFTLYAAAGGCDENGKNACRNCPHLMGATCEFLFDIIGLSISRRDLTPRDRQLILDHLKHEKGGC